MPGRPCLTCGIRVPTGRSRCPKHELEHERARLELQPYRAGYHTPEHKAFIRRVRARARGVCDGCRGHETAADRFEVDHIVPLSRASSLEELKALNDPSNGALLCRPCHNRKTNLDRGLKPGGLPKRYGSARLEAGERFEPRPPVVG